MFRARAGNVPSAWQSVSFCLISAATLFAAGCGSSDDADPAAGTAGDKPGIGSNGKLQIVTTCGMVTDIVRVVAGEHADVTGLIGEGIDPHLFKAGRNDVAALLDADVVFYAGLMLEGRMADDFTQVGNGGKPVYPVTYGIDKSLLHEPPEFDGHWDPHCWMDVSLWSLTVQFVADSLAKEDAAHAADYAANAKAYLEQLNELHEYCKSVVATIPEDQRYLVTAHDAFGYFSSAYSIQVRAIQGISTESEAAIADINQLVDFIVDKKVPAIFVESSVPKKTVQGVIESCAERGHTLTIGAELYSDAMGQPGTYEGTYIGMMDHNATRIARALGGEAPEKGWQQKLGAESTDEG